MVDRLWSHALQFLDNYRLSEDGDGCDVEELYKFSDQTGILDIHGRWRAQAFSQEEADLKILYYELIRMITNYERERCRDSQTYDSTKSICKIEGYQDLTNRLQRIINQQFMLEIRELNRKCDQKTSPLTNGHDKNDESRLGEIEKKVDNILLDNQKLKDDVRALSARNHVLEKEIRDLKHRLEEKQDRNLPNKEQNLTLFSSSEIGKSELSDRVNAVTEDIAKVSDKMQSIISQANTLLINDATHLERISNLETQLAEINGKLSNLESADLYLQEAHKVLTERTSLIEKYSKYIEEKVKLVSSSNTVSNEDTVDHKYQELDDRVSLLESRNSPRERFTENYINMSNMISEESNTMTKLSINVLEGKIKDSKMNNLSKYDELLDKYKRILGRIQNMESLLNEQSQTLSDHSRIFSDKYLKFPVSNGDRVKENRITKMVTEKISEIRREEERSFMNFETRTIQGRESNVFEFIEMLVTMNKSLNQMMEDFVVAQNQLKMLKTHQSSTSDELSYQGNTFSEKFSKIDEKIELADIKQLCDYENLNQKNHQIEDNFQLLKERVAELEKVKNTNIVPRRAVEEDFSIRRRSYEKLIGSNPSNHSKSSNRKFFGLFGAGKGSCCC